MIFSLSPRISALSSLSRDELLGMLASLDATIARLRNSIVEDIDLPALKAQVYETLSEITGYSTVTLHGLLDGDTSYSIQHAVIESRYRSVPSIFTGTWAANLYMFANFCYYAEKPEAITTHIKDLQYAFLSIYLSGGYPSSLLNKAIAAKRAYERYKLQVGPIRYAYVSYTQRSYTLEGISFVAYNSGYVTSYYKDGSYWHSNEYYSYSGARSSKTIYWWVRNRRYFEYNTGAQIVFGPYNQLIYERKVANVYDLPSVYDDFVAVLDQGWPALPATCVQVAMHTVSIKMFALSCVGDFFKKVLPISSEYTGLDEGTTTVTRQLVNRLSGIVGNVYKRKVGEQIVFDVPTGKYRRIHPNGTVISKYSRLGYRNIALVPNVGPTGYMPSTPGTHWELDKYTDFRDAVDFMIAYPTVAYVSGYSNVLEVMVLSNTLGTVSCNEHLNVPRVGTLPDEKWFYTIDAGVTWVAGDSTRLIPLPSGSYPVKSIWVALDSSYLETGVTIGFSRYSIAYNVGIVTAGNTSITTPPSLPYPPSTGYTSFRDWRYDTFNEDTGIYERLTIDSAGRNYYDGLEARGLLWMARNTLLPYKASLDRSILAVQNQDTSVSFYADHVIYGGVSNELLVAMQNSSQAIGSLIAASDALTNSPAFLSVWQGLIDIVDKYHADNVFAEPSTSGITNEEIIAALSTVDRTHTHLSVLATEFAALDATTYALNVARNIGSGPYIVGPLTTGNYPYWDIPTSTRLLVFYEFPYIFANMFSKYLMNVRDIPARGTMLEYDYLIAIENFSALYAAPQYYETVRDILDITEEANPIEALDAAHRQLLTYEWIKIRNTLTLDSPEYIMHNALGTVLECKTYSVLPTSGLYNPIDYALYGQLAQGDIAVCTDCIADTAKVIASVEGLKAAMLDPELYPVLRQHRPGTDGLNKYINIYATFASTLASAIFCNDAAMEEAVAHGNMVRALVERFPPEAVAAWNPMGDIGTKSGVPRYLEFFNISSMLEAVAGATSLVKGRLTTLLDAYALLGIDPYTLLHTSLPTGTITVSEEGDEIMTGIPTIDPSSPYYPLVLWYTVDCVAVLGVNSYTANDPDCYFAFSRAGDAYPCPTWWGYRWVGFGTPYVYHYGDSANYFYYMLVRPYEYGYFKKSAAYWTESACYYTYFVPQAIASAKAKLPELLASRASLATFLGV